MSPWFSFHASPTDRHPNEASPRAETRPLPGNWILQGLGRLGESAVLVFERRATGVVGDTTALKRAWTEVGCLVPYMGFNLLPLSVIPELRLTDRGLVDGLVMRIVPLFEPA